MNRHSFSSLLLSLIRWIWDWFFSLFTRMMNLTIFPLWAFLVASEIGDAKWNSQKTFIQTSRDFRNFNYSDLFNAYYRYSFKQMMFRLHINWKSSNSDFVNSNRWIRTSIHPYPEIMNLLKRRYLFQQIMASSVQIRLRFWSNLHRWICWKIVDEFDNGNSFKAMSYKPY